MDKELFRKLIKVHKTITIGLNAFDPSEISAMYSLNFNGDVYEIFSDNSFQYLFNIDDDAALQKFSEDILQDVVSHEYDNEPNTDDDHFERCVAYIKANLEHWEIEEGWSYIGKRMGLPNELEGRIYDLIDEYAEDNDLPDDWWSLYDVEELFMEIEND
jgi:hypothetical protein